MPDLRARTPHRNRGRYDISRWMGQDLTTGANLRVTPNADRQVVAYSQAKQDVWIDRVCDFIDEYDRGSLVDLEAVDARGDRWDR